MPVWLVVKAGIPLSEVLTWDVEDVLKFVGPGCAEGAGGAGSVEN